MKKSNTQQTKLLSELDRMIREGLLGEARSILLDLNLQKISRDNAAALADIGRRLNVPKFMLQILKPIIRSEMPINPPPTPRELALYATGLSRLGSFNEAENILDKLDGKDSPEILLYQAQNQMLQWNYTRPIPYLTKYIRSKKISDYERLVGLVNLAASHVWNMKWTLGEEVLAQIQNEVLKKPDLESYKLIHGYSFQLMAEMAILKNDRSAARTLLIKSRELLQGSRSRYEFFVKKWQTILDFLDSPTQTECLIQLHSLKNEAEKLKDWETKRDCEFYESLTTRNDSLFLKVYFGTPYPSYRKRIATIYKPEFNFPEDFEWTLMEGEKSLTPPRIFNMRTACEEDGSASLVNKPLLLKLIKVLSKDFFRPTPVGALVDELYPGEYFNPITSPQKAYKAVIRIREWFKENNIPLDLSVDNENYQLIALQPYVIKVFGDRKKSAPVTKLVELDTLFQFTKNRPFTANDAAKELKMSPRTVQRFLELAVAERKIKNGGGSINTIPLHQ